MDRGKDAFYNKYIKRKADFILAFIALIILSPFLLVFALIGCFAMKGNPFFVQRRPGLHEEIFKLIKFRTMSNEKDEKGELLPDTKRLNAYGRFLRKTSIDELPELINILIGDMSLVGPRPLAVIYLDYYTKEEHERHSVRPGLTGLAQINGRNAISWEEKFAYDLQYVSEVSFRKDLMIIIKTVGKVVRHDQIGQAEEAPLSLHLQRKEQKKKGEEQ